MVARSKEELLDVARREFERLTILLDQVDSDMALAEGDDGLSIKDVIGHRAHWLQLFFGWYDDGVAGRPLAYSAPGYNGNETKRYNADVKSAQHDLGWLDVRSMLDSAHLRLLALLEQLSETDLYGGPMVTPHKWSTGRWAEANGPSHYRSAAKYVRAILRSTSP